MKPKRKFIVLIDRAECGNYPASFPGLRGCHTQAKTIEKLMKHAREVIGLYLECGEEVDDSLEFVGVHQISI
jgi:predicted RNase H-like HicB family nuclease